MLTTRERELYDRLHELYPSHRLFVQVALSQLVDVKKDHPEWAATRNRIDRLVADFVLCRPDLTIVTVIELDDWSHKLPGRPEADARKSKALADAGLRLIRIPEGPIPSAATLRKLIDGSDEPPSAHAQGFAQDDVTKFRILDDEPPIAMAPGASDWEWRAHKAAWRGALKLLLTVVVLVGGWYVYMKVIPRIVQTSLDPLAQKSQPIAGELPKAPPLPVAVAAPRASLGTPGPSKAELEAKRESDFQALQAARKEKALAWGAFFKPEANCDRPVDWKAQVDCGNQYMRAKQAFEVQWARAHGGSADGSVVIDNHSFDKAAR